MQLTLQLETRPLAEAAAYLLSYLALGLCATTYKWNRFATHRAELVRLHRDAFLEVHGLTLDELRERYVEPDIAMQYRDFIFHKFAIPTLGDDIDFVDWCETSNSIDYFNASLAPQVDQHLSTITAWTLFWPAIPLAAVVTSIYHGLRYLMRPLKLSLQRLATSKFLRL